MLSFQSARGLKQDAAVFFQRIGENLAIKRSSSVPSFPTVAGGRLRCPYDGWSYDACDPTLEGMKLGCFDRALGLIRERIQRIYRGKVG